MIRGYHYLVRGLGLLVRFNGLKILRSTWLVGKGQRSERMHHVLLPMCKIFLFALLLDAACWGGFGRQVRDILHIIYIQA